MFFVIFEGIVPAAKNAVSGAYYTKMAPLVHDQDGFISETSYISPEDESKHLLFSMFEDDMAARRWRLNTEHLKVQHKARHGVFEDYRLRCGYDLTTEELSTTTEQSGRCIVIYEGQTSDKGPGLSSIDLLKNGRAAGVFNEATEITTYQGEASIVLLLSFPSKAAAAKCMAAQAFIDLQRTPNSKHVIRITRDYGKSDRKEAPAGADEAQEAA